MSALSGANTGSFERLRQGRERELALLALFFLIGGTSSCVPGAGSPEPPPCRPHNCLLLIPLRRWIDPYRFGKPRVRLGGVLRCGERQGKVPVDLRGWPGQGHDHVHSEVTGCADREWLVLASTPRSHMEEAGGRDEIASEPRTAGTARHRTPAATGMPSRKSISTSFSLAATRATISRVCVSITCPELG